MDRLDIDHVSGGLFDQEDQDRWRWRIMLGQFLGGSWKDPYADRREPGAGSASSPPRVVAEAAGKAQPMEPHALSISNLARREPGLC